MFARFLAKLLSILFLSVLVTSFLNFKYATYFYFVFVAISIILFFLNGNKVRLFLVNTFVLMFILYSFFVGIDLTSKNEVKQDVYTTETKTLMQERLITLREMIKNDMSEADVLTYMYQSIELGESVLSTSTPQSYLDLGYVYEIADSLGISHAREKAIENFKVYCKYKSSDRACSLLDK